MNSIVNIFKMPKNKLSTLKKNTFYKRKEEFGPIRMVICMKTFPKDNKKNSIQKYLKQHVSEISKITIINIFKLWLEQEHVKINM